MTAIAVISVVAAQTRARARSLDIEHASGLRDIISCHSTHPVAGRAHLKRDVPSAPPLVIADLHEISRHRSKPISLAIATTRYGTASCRQRPCTYVPDAKFARGR